MMEGNYLKLVTLLRGMEGAVVAFSGGVDSSLLLAAAKEALGEKALAVTAVSPTYPKNERKLAKDIASKLGARHIEVETSEFGDPAFRLNPPTRCYACKQHLFRELRAIAARERLAEILDGGNLDDLNDFRPGRRAAGEFGVRSPFVELGYTKSDIRETARMIGLAVWDLPAAACLSSRIPYGQEITIERLARIEQAEDFLHALGLRLVRARDYGDLVRIETGVEAWSMFADADFRLRVVVGLKSIGYKYVTLDLAGYRTGAMNEALRPGFPRSRE